MRAALRLLAEEGLDQAWARHRRNAEMLWSGLESLGLSMHVPADRRLPTLTTVRIPEGVDGKAFSQQLLNNHGIEVGGGLGTLAGKIWRIGLMGYNSTPENVSRLLNLFETELPRFSDSPAALLEPAFQLLLSLISPYALNHIHAVVCTCMGGEIKASP